MSKKRFTPEEIIHAAGGIPFRILGQKKSVVCSDSHLQSYSCSLVRTGLDMALTNRLDFLEGAAVRRRRAGDDPAPLRPQVAGNGRLLAVRPNDVAWRTKSVRLRGEEREKRV